MTFELFLASKSARFCSESHKNEKVSVIFYGFLPKICSAYEYFKDKFHKRSSPDSESCYE